jgi:hypothetical protein
LNVASRRSPYTISLIMINDSQVLICHQKNLKA